MALLFFWEGYEKSLVLRDPRSPTIATVAFDSTLFCDKQLIGNGDFDAPADNGGQDVWILQIIEQQRDDCFIPYHPTALLLTQSKGPNTPFRRVGYAILEDEKLDFFDCKPKKIEIV